MKVVPRYRLLLVLLLCCTLPARANNPPEPDGLFSILLIFPAVILGRKLAGVVSGPRSLAKKIAVPLVLTASVILCMGGTGIAALPLLIIFLYGIHRAVQILRQGQGRKRYFIGAAVIALVLFGITDYFASLLAYDLGPSRESLAIYQLRSLATAETEFRTTTYSRGTSSPEYGTMKELEDAKLFARNLAPNVVQSGYLYGETIEKQKNQFLFYAVPAFPSHPPSKWFHFFPGGSLLLGILRKNNLPETGVRSFAVDESGVIRVSSDWKPGTPVSHEEALRWQVFK